MKKQNDIPSLRTSNTKLFSDLKKHLMLNQTIKFSLHSRYYAEARNKCRGTTSSACAWATQCNTVSKFDQPKNQTSDLPHLLEKKKYHKLRIRVIITAILTAIRIYGGYFIRLPSTFFVQGDTLRLKLWYSPNESFTSILQRCKQNN